MIEITNTKLMIPENDLQDLWMLAGRVEALIALCEHESKACFHSIDTDVVMAVLGYEKAGAANTD